MNYVYLCYQRPHSAHELWAKTLVECFGGRIVPLGLRNLHATFLRNKAKVTLAEGVRPTIAAWPYKNIGRIEKLFMVAVGYPFAKKSLTLKDNAIIHALRSLDGIISVSSLQRDFIANRFNISNVPIRVCYPHVNVEEFLPVSPCYAEELAICFVSALVGLKGADLLPEILGKINREIRDVKMYVIGTGALLDSLRQEARNCQGLCVLGWQPHSVIRRVFTKCRVLLAPSRADTFCVPVIEAMAAGLVPVVTEMVGAKEFVEKLNPRLIVPVDIDSIADRVVDVLSMDQDGSRALSVQAKQVAASWNSKRAKETFLASLKTLETIDSFDVEKGGH